MYGLDSIRRFQEGGFTDAQVAEYFANNPGLTERQIAEAMRQTGVSPAQVARVTGADPGYVAQRYDQYLDLVDQATVRQPVTAVSPALNLVNTLPEARLISSGNVSGTGAGVVSSGPPVGSLENPAVQSPIKLGPVPATRVMTRPEQEKAFTQIYAQTQVDDFVDSVLRGASTGDFSEAASILSRNAADPRFGEDVYGVAADLLNTDPRFAGLREQVGGAAYTPENLRSFVTNQLAAQQTPAAPSTAALTPAEGIASIPTGPQTTPGPGQIYGMPRFERQEFTPLTFAPLRRGATQLRPAMFMPGLTSGQAPLGGSGFTPEALRGAVGGRSPEDIAYLMDVGGVSPAELAAATEMPTGQIQAYYNQFRPSGAFSTAAPTPVAPQNFALQTGAYGAPTPTFFTPNYPTPAPETPAKTTASTAPVEDLQYAAREGGVIKMAEGGKAMPKLSASEAGSKFDVSEFIDEQGRLVGGYSRPVYKDNVIVGYDYQPYQRDVVFNPRLAEAEARGMSDEEREAARRGLIVRQGLTGVDPYAGGLAGIQAREALMRSRPQYYSYAEGGLADVAQNLADRGRKGDSMLVHMAPEEVAGLRALARAQGTDLTINPRTGLPEAFSLKKLFKAASFVLPFIPIPGLFGMSSLLTRSILSGVAAGASAKGGFDLKQALGGGLKAYALGSLGEKLGGGPAAGQGTAPTTAAVTGPEAATVDVMGGGAPTITTPSGDVSLASSYSGARVPASLPGAPQYQFSVQGPDLGGAGVSVPMSLDAPFSPGDPTVPRPEGTSSFITPEGQGFGKPLTKGFDIAAAGIGGLSLEKAAEEQRSYELEAAAARREDEERKRRFDELFARTLGNVRTAKAGGSVSLAKGGMTYMEAGGTTGPTGEPRVVQGTGDGMSDSVPATIEGVQEARLANDEFVIPADVVSNIGNGSSNAGAKKLYDMMDRIRKASHGTTKQPPEINAESMMPA